MKVSFIIPLFNCLGLTQAMLASLQRTLPAGLDHEVILVDDGSTDGTRAWLATLPPPGRPVLNERNLGFAGACNRGAALAGGDIFVFLNNDLVLEPGWLAPLLDTFRRFPAAGLVGNVQRNAATGTIDHTGIFFNLKGKPEHSTARPPAARLGGWRRVPALTGACFAVQATLWRQLGGFDAGFINGGEDIDLCLRAAAAGRRNYVALRSVVRHHISASPGRKRHDEQNSFRLARRWHHVIAGEIARAWCRQHLAAHWEEPRDYPDLRFARRALYHVLHLRPNPPFGALAGARTALAAELARWRAMFPGEL